MVVLAKMPSVHSLAVFEVSRHQAGSRVITELYPVTKFATPTFEEPNDSGSDDDVLVNQ